MKKQQLGMTLIETTVVMAMATILAGVAAPSFKNSFERARLKAAADEQIANLYLAKSEALKSNSPAYFSVRTGATQCYGFRVGAAPCDCAQADLTQPDACTLARTVVGPEKGLTLSTTFTPGTSGSFEPARGTFDLPGQVTWLTAGGYTLKTAVSSLGRVSVCAPAGQGTVSGYQTTGC